jgi:ketosteroid isomerase-like protein
MPCPLMSLVVLLMTSTPGDVPAPEADREALTRLSQEWMDAVARRDRPALEQLLASDYELRPVSGEQPSVPRAEWLENAVNMQWENRGYSNLHVEVDGDVGIVTARYAFRVDPGDWKPTVSATADVVDVWKRRDGRWQVQGRLLGESSITRWIDRVTGGVAMLAIVGVVALGRRLMRRRTRAAGV